MSMMQTIAIVLGILIAVVGILGGLLSLPSSVQKYRRDRKQHGSKGVGFCVVSRLDKNDGITVRYLVVEDLFQFLTNFAKKDTEGNVTNIQALGDYYDVTIVYPPDTDLRFSIR